MGAMAGDCWRQCKATTTSGVRTKRWGCSGRADVSTERTRISGTTRGPGSIRRAAKCGGSNAQGMLEARGRRWFVARRWPISGCAVERVDGKLLVSYRHMYIREIDPAAVNQAPWWWKRSGDAKRRRLWGSCGGPPEGDRRIPRTENRT